MTETVRNYEALAIYAAVESGYFVMVPEGESVRGMCRLILFAGTLEACLSWVKGHIRL